MSAVGYWMGVPIEELSREELIEVIAHLSKELERYRTPDMIDAIVRGKVSQLREGRR